MVNILIKLWYKLKESIFSVLPVTAIVLILALTPFLQLTTKEIFVFIISAILLIIGISLFSLGADTALSPMGEYIGEGLINSRKVHLVVIICFIMGFLTTIAEPDLSILAEQVNHLINNITLLVFVGIGVGAFLVFSILKII